MITLNEAPSIVKYMGSKKKILKFVVEGINEAYLGKSICDLFAGSSSLAGAIGTQVNFISNDIQLYSGVMANLYLYKNKKILTKNKIKELEEKFKIRKEQFNLNYPKYQFNYYPNMSIEDFSLLEESQKLLIEKDFSKEKYHLFTKTYSGTYWNYEQCQEIDIIRGLAEEYKGTFLFYAILNSLMFAMAYSSQSTGHYAQYRDATSEKSKNNILIYRLKSLSEIFFRKIEEFREKLKNNLKDYEVYSLDYIECLDKLKPNTTVYADPPYCFVHYSRFYHVLETIVKYDYPNVAHKGRYREDRHQSPFCIKTKVNGAFQKMFEKIKEKNNSIVLSYSNTGMITFENLYKLALETFGLEYKISVKYLDYTHSTMGRKEDKHKEVQEILLIAKPIILK